MRPIPLAALLALALLPMRPGTSQAVTPGTPAPPTPRPAPSPAVSALVERLKALGSVRGMPERRAGLLALTREAEALGDAGLLRSIVNLWSQQGQALLFTEPREALLWLKEGGNLAEKLTPGHIVVAGIRASGGRAATLAGDLPEARRQFLGALRILDRLQPEGRGTAIVFASLGSVLALEGDAEAARDCYLRAVSVLRKEGQKGDLVAMLQNASSAAGVLGDREEEERLLDEAVAILGDRAREAEDPLVTLRLAARHFDRREWASARELAGKSLAALEGRPDSLVYVSGAHVFLGHTAMEAGDVEEADRQLRQALSLAGKLHPEGAGVAEAEEALSELSLRRGDLTAAEAHALRAWRIRTGDLAGSLSDAAVRGSGSPLGEVAHQLARIRVRRNDSWGAFLAAEQGRGQATLRLLRERGLLRTVLGGELRDAYDAASERLERAQAEVGNRGTELVRAELRLREAKADGLAAAQAAAGETKTRFEEARRALLQARLERDEVWNRVRRSDPRLDLAGTDLAGLKRRAAKLPSGSLFLSYAAGRRGTLLFLLQPPRGGKPAQVEVFTLPVTVRELQEQVRRFADLVQEERAEAIARGRELYQALFPPKVREALGRSRLVLSPDGPLWELPFAALVTTPAGRPPRFLGLQHSLTVVPSLELFAASRDLRSSLAPGRQPRVLAVGGVTFARGGTDPGKLTASARALPALERVLNGRPGASEERSFLLAGDTPPPPLPATRAEARAVAALYGGTPLLGAAATEPAVRGKLPQADVVHLATHGYLHPYAPMASGVLLAPPPDPAAGTPGNDGALQAWEIFGQLRLRAEVVVLAACETGRGKNVRNEGLVGVSRALQYAGARSVVASQWRVRDDCTTVLMQRFHRELRSGAAKDEALRRAMGVVAARPGWEHPYHWGAFTLTGDPENPMVPGATGKPGVRRR